MEAPIYVCGHAAHFVTLPAPQRLNETNLATFARQLACRCLACSTKQSAHVVSPRCTGPMIEATLPPGVSHHA